MMRNIGIIFIFFLTASLTVFSQKNIDLKELFNNVNFEKGPSVSVLVIKEGKVKTNRSFGHAAIEKGQKAGGNTNYYMADISNQFTAMGILLLSNNNKLKLSDKAAEIIDGFPGYGKNVTIKHLLQQNSGLPHFAIPIELSANSNPITNQDVLSYLKKQESLLFSPGKKIDINPVNYIMLALIIEEISGDSYAGFIKNEILKPLGMKKSGVYDGSKYFWPWKKIKNKAVGYNFTGTNYIQDNSIEKIHITGSTGLYVSPNDYIKWMKAWETEKLIKANTIDNAFKFNFMPGYTKFYGYGWQIGFNNGRRYAFQSASRFGNTHLVVYVPSEKITVAVFSNQGGLYGLRKKAFKILNQYSANEYIPE
jgi:CubicO group peptidase (beta-lactamase class C family)